MSVETNARFITEFNEAYPRKGDLIKEGDDHMRLIKAVLKNTMPGFDQTINMKADKLNKLDALLEPTDDTVKFMGNILVADKKTINMGENVVTGLSDPIEESDAVNMRYLKNEGAGYMWPINSIFITVDARDPKEIFGFGKWEKFSEGRVLIGTGSDKDDTGTAKLIALGAKGGVYKNVLKVENLPAHNHSIDITGTAEAAGSHDHQIWSHDSTANDGGGGPNGEFVKAWNQRGSYPKGGAITGTDSAAAHTHPVKVTGSSSNTGSGEGCENMMPWVGVHIWKRVE